MRGGERNDFESRLLLSLRQFEVFDLGISGFESVEIEEKKVFISDFFTDGNVIAGGGN